jgi:hypothetical protein
MGGLGEILFPSFLKDCCAGLSEFKEKYMKKTLLTLASSLLATAVQAQTCNGNIVKTKPDSQYELLNNDTEVKDKKTGLIWQRCALGLTGITCSTGTASTYTWEAALAQAVTVASNTNVAWRLPNLKELKSLVETACIDQAINETVFPATPSNIWSSSAANASGFYAQAWYVVSNRGKDEWIDKSSTTVSVRLVRSQ